MLPEHVRAYRSAVAADDQTAESQSRVQVCSVLESSLDDHLRGRTGWDPGSWVDGVLPATFEALGSGFVTVAGAAVWSKKRDWFLDPLHAQVELSADGAAVRHYSLRFGDADTGLGKFQYRPYSKDLYRSLPGRWLFTFG
jgi:hypothetical protein